MLGRRKFMNSKRFVRFALCVLIGGSLLQVEKGLFFVATAAQPADSANTQNTPSKGIEPIAWEQIGAKAGADYHGEGLSVVPTAAGARLRCAFQRLDGEATGEGLWLV